MKIKSNLTLITAYFFLFLFSSPTLKAQTADCGCDHTITRAGTYRPKTATSGSSQYFLDVYPGQTICIKAGTYGDMRFYGFHGTAQEPIFIKNCGGQVNLSNNTFHGLSFENCGFIELSGNGDPAVEYGIRISGTGTGGSGLSISGKSTDFTVRNLEISGANFAGMMIKTDPTCDSSTWKNNFEMHNVVLTHNYVHDVRGEGFYIGNSFFTSGYPTICGGQPTRVYPHRILGLDIHDNITRRTGCEGIQYGCSPNANVYDNLVEDAGIAPFDAFQDNGIQIGDGSSGLCHHNIIRRVGGSAISAVGNIGNVKISNNLIIRSGNAGIYVNDNDSTIVNSLFEIYNNSIIRTGGDGIHLRNERNSNIVRNNALIEIGYAAYLTYMQGATATTSNNLMIPSVVSGNFVDTINYHPTTASTTVNSGYNLLAEGITDDLLGNPRPPGSPFDVGAYELIPCTGIDKVSPVLKNCPKNFTVYTGDGTAQATWTPPTATDNCSSTKLTASITPNSVFNLGGTKVIYTATDAAKNKATCSFIVTVAKTTSCKSDHIKPTIFNCPNDTIVNPTAYPVSVNWVDPTADDNCTISSFISNYPNNTSFTAGKYNVIYIARDASNNADTCRFSITVARLISQCDNDTTKPFFKNCPRDTTVATSTRSSVVSWVAPSAFDNCIPPSVRSNYTSGQTFSIGKWHVIYVARDLKNNLDTCKFAITIVNPCDTERTPPVLLNCPKDTVIKTQNYFANVSWILPTATDNCSTVTLSSNYLPDRTFGVGTTVVVYTARDRAGNKTTCQFKIKIDNICSTDSIIPVFSNCPRDTTVYIANGVSIANVSWTPPTATDNCTAIPSVFSNILPESIFGLGTRQVIYRAVDTRGNIGICHFNVSVVHGSAPLSFAIKNGYSQTETDDLLVKSYKFFPNPSGDGFCSVQMTLKDAVSVNILLSDNLGREVKQQVFQGAAGLNQWEIDLSDVPPGVYYLTPSIKWLHLKPTKIVRL